MTNILIEAMVEDKEQIIDLNVSQIEHGIAPDGNKIGEYASDAYASFKQSIGSQAPKGDVDLKLSGDFISGFYGEPYFGSSPEFSGLFENSKDSKTSKLESKYSGKIFGIAPENRSAIGEIILLNAQTTILNRLTNGLT